MPAYEHTLVDADIRQGYVVKHFAYAEVWFIRMVTVLVIARLSTTEPV